MAAVKRTPAKTATKRTRKETISESQMSRVFRAVAKALEARETALGDLRRGHKGARQKIEKAEAVLEAALDEARNALEQDRAAGTQEAGMPPVLNQVIKEALPRFKDIAKRERTEQRSATRKAIRDVKRIAARGRTEAERLVKETKKEGPRLTPRSGDMTGATARGTRRETQAKRVRAGKAPTRRRAVAAKKTR